jgi:hypothetical protein
MKEYKITLPDSLKDKELEIKQFILAQHWQDDIFRSGFCADVLGIERFDFQTKVLGKFNISFMGDGE